MKYVIIMVVFSLVYMFGIELANKKADKIVVDSNKDIVIKGNDNLYSVSITGAINNPGTYSVNKGEKLSYLLHLAGGVKNNSDSSAYNLDAILENGITYYIPYKSDKNEKVSINTSSLAKLDSLPGVGNVIATRIVSYRNKKGPFTSIEQIKQVNGIGDSLFNQIKDLICL